MSQVGESTELIFSIYNSAIDQQITEDYPISLNGQGMPDVEETGKLKCLFAGLPYRELFAFQLHLVMKITRKGRLSLDSKKEKGKPDW